ncbi:hypothetical protein [Asticcacaulis sp.]|uniref:hypothetical protein n=1 Tax=Asticcacaulis sp. TaxID=1872648 RepID=UPI003F7BA929
MKPDPHPWSPKEDRYLEDAVETDMPGLLTIGIGLFAGLVCTVIAVIGGLIWGGFALWHWVAALIH